MEELREEKKTFNIQSEVLFVGAILKQPELLVEYSRYIKSKYDLYDEATKFFYNEIERMYTTFSQTVEENTVNAYMSQDKDKMKVYKSYGGFKTIKKWSELAIVDDFKNYYNTIKKYSLVREYERFGFPIQKILNHPKFDIWLPNDIYKMIRAKADQINTVILANEESVVLNEGNAKLVQNWLLKPQMGLELPWKLVNEMFRGARLGKLVCMGYLSNEGKSRNLMKLIAHITLVLKEKFLLLSNEMDEEDLRACLVTTVINNEEFKELHGIDIRKPEKEIVLGRYRSDKDNSFIDRRTDENGEYIESEEEYALRVYNESEEFRKVTQIMKWVDEQTEGKIFFKDVGSDYSNEAIEFECRKHKMVYDVKYFGYDTLKGFGIDDWQTVKQTTTKIKELMKELKMFGWAVIQLTDDSVFTDIFEFSSNNIANAKQLKHVVDHLILGKRLNREDYHKYEYVPHKIWGEERSIALDLGKVYYGWKIDKNRGGSKDLIPLIEVDLDTNEWAEVGYLVKKGK
ncbi:TPA: hypothetical protein ACF2DD_002173 [Clostridium perfringens]|uniref:hypothetical protein n=1 Tax=Clostridium perfringens TaxID=1502 RepID=UPI00338FE448|nr:hypothetical protein [Clostridium perfringens]